jgi:hypothetical protein
MIAYPIKHRVLMSGKVVVSWIVATWLVSCALSATSVFRGGRRDGTNIYTVCAIIIALSTAIYGSTYYMLKKQSKTIALQTTGSTRAQEMRVLQQKQFLKTIIIIASISALCVLPSMVYFQTSIFLGVNPFHLSRVTVSRLFLGVFCTNFAVNPIIYVVRLPNYRKTFCLLYGRRCS